MAASLLRARLAALRAWLGLRSRPRQVFGAALVASGTHLRIRAANAIGIVLVGWSAIDVAAGTASAPTAQIGRVALLPLTTSPLS